MAKVITTELQHSGASGANITLDSSKNVTCENNLTVDGTATLTGAVTLPNDTVTTAKINNGAVTGPKLADGMVVTNKEWHQKSWSTHTGDTNWHGNVFVNTQCKITPTSATNKILVMGCGLLQVDNNNASVTQTGVDYKIERIVSGQSDVECWIGSEYIVQPESSGNDWIYAKTFNFSFVDDPGTTSEIEYKVSTKAYNSTDTVNIGTANYHKGITFLELKNS